MGRAVSAVRSQVELLRRAIEFVRQVSERLRVLEVYVVGSRARGDYTVDSDLDLVLVVDDEYGNLNQLERLELIRDLIQPGIECRVYTASEWYSGASTWIKQLRKEAKKLDELLGEAEKLLANTQTQKNPEDKHINKTGQDSYIPEGNPET